MYAEEASSVIQSGQVWEKGQNHLYGADCMDILAKLPCESIDLIIADPPYYRMKGSFDFVFHSEKEYLEWCSLWVAECCRVLKPTGASRTFPAE